MKTNMPFKIRRICYLFLGIIALVILFNTSTFAQATDTIVPIGKDAEKILKNINLNSDGFNFWKDNFKGNWAGIDFGFNTFLNRDYSGYETEFMKNDILFSNSIHLNLIQQNIGLQRNRNNFGIVTGLGIQYQYYRLSDTTTIERTADDIIIPKTFNYGNKQSSKLYLFSLTVPVLAEIQIPINNYKNRLYFSSGMYFSYRIGSYTKIKYQDNQKKKLKVTDNFSLQNFKYGIMFRTGYRWINFYAIYDLTPFYKVDKGPELTPFTFGVTLLRF